MSSLRALCCLPSVKKQKHDFNSFFFFVHCIIKQFIIEWVFCDIQNSQGQSVMVINLTQLANNLYLDLDCSGYHKNLIQQYCLKL